MVSSRATRPAGRRPAGAAILACLACLLAVVAGITGRPVAARAAEPGASPVPPPAPFALHGQWQGGLSWHSPSPDRPSLRPWQELSLSLSASRPAGSWLATVELQGLHREEAGFAGDAGPSSTPFFYTGEASLTLSSAAGFSVRGGRIHFQLGPVGLLAANPFDALTGISLNLPLTLPLAAFPGEVEAVYARLDTSFVTYLPYVYDTDDYLAFRVSFPGARPGLPPSSPASSAARADRQTAGIGSNVTWGLTWLRDGLAGEMGIALDWQRHAPRHSLVGELAAFRASPTADNFQGWVLGGIGSVDLWQGPDYLVNLNFGSVHPGFTPLASNLASAGGNLNFANGSTGVELNLTWQPRRDLLWESELSCLWRFGQPDHRAVLRVTKALQRGLEAVWTGEWRPPSGRLVSAVKFVARF